MASRRALGFFGGCCALSVFFIVNTHYTSKKDREDMRKQMIQDKKRLDELDRLAAEAKKEPS